MCTPSERNAEEEKCLIKEKFQRELSGQGEEKTKGKQGKIHKGPLPTSARPSCRPQGQQLCLFGAHCREEQAFPLRAPAPPRWGQRRPAAWGGLGQARVL